MQNFADDAKQPESLGAEDMGQHEDYAQFNREVREGDQYGAYGRDEGTGQHYDSEPSDDRFESTNKATSHSQRRLVRSERPVLHDTQRREARQPNYVAPASKSTIPYMVQDQIFQQRYRRDNPYGMQRPQVPLRGLPGEPNSDEPTHSSRVDPKCYEAGVASYQSPTTPQLYSKPKAASTFHNESLVMPDQRQNYADADHQEVSQNFQGHRSAYMNITAAQARMKIRQPRTQTSGSGNASFVATAPRKILTNRSSPDALSWDSPFPAFGVKRKNNKPQSQADLHHSIAQINLKDERCSGRNTAQSIQTASSKSSQNSLYIGGKNGSTDGMEEHSNLVSRQPQDLHFGIEEARSKTQGPNYEPSGGWQRRLNPQGPQSSHRLGSPFPRARASEKLRTEAPIFNSGGSNLDPRRSRTMPSNMAQVAEDLSSQRAYVNDARWYEPEPAFGPRGPETIGPAIKGHANAESHSSHLHHSAQNSLGEVYDSYYHETQHYQYLHKDSQVNQPDNPHDEDMPNFDAVSSASPTYNHGMTIDDHLAPQQDSAVPPEISNRPQHKVPLPLTHNLHGTGHVNRSKSQPNLKDHRSSEAQFNNGFVFDLPGDTPPIPSLSRHHENSGTRSNLSNPYPEGNKYTDEQYKSPQVQRRGAPLAVGSGSRAISNGTYQQTLQGFISPERHRSPLIQSEIRNDRPNMLESKPNLANPEGFASPPKNPDALPPHPVPIRLGLMQDSASQQVANPPAFMKQNDNPSSFQNSKPMEMTGSSMTLNASYRVVPVTHEELDRLRHILKSNPSDQKTQLLLAKKMVEAASVLVDESGRVDSKTKLKAREKFILDAHKIVKKLVSSRFTDATFYLADCYSRGLLGLEVDTKEAFSLYQTAAKAGHAQSAYRVAVCCEMGQEEGGGTKRDLNKAMQWYQRAAMLGDTPAMYKLGVIQLKGLLGQPKKPKDALKWLTRAADQANEENPHALHELGLMHEETGSAEYVTKDNVYSRQLFTQASNLGYKFSQFRLGCAYEYGLMGCPIDPRQSIAWYSKAAMQGEHQSELALSGWYLTGLEGVLQQSDTEAYLWARKAAQAGLAKAEYAMGYFTEVGIGAPANLEDAKRWYWRAASQNFPKARDRLEALRKGGAKMEKSRVSRSALRKQSEGECIIM